MALGVLLSLSTVAFAFGEEAAAVPETAVVKAELKLKVRWQEKQVKGKRVVTVFVKNEGQDLKDVDAEIVLKGKGEKERQTAKVKLNVIKNVEKPMEILVGSFIEAVAAGSGFGTMKPMGSIVGVEVVIGETVFSAK